MLPTFSLWGIQFNTFPFIIFLALLSSIIPFAFAKKYKKFYQVTIFRLCLPVLACAAFGARLFSAVTLMSISKLSFWHNLLYGGSVFYGGLLGGTIGLLIVCLINHYEFLVFSDLFATLLPLGHAIGRIGCYFNGCCYGSQYDGILAVPFFINQVKITVFPTWFVEAGFCLLLFVYFQFLHKKNTVGNRTAIYLISYSIFRFLIEFMRGDEIRGHFSFLSSSQIISLFILLLGLYIQCVSRKENIDNYLFNKERESNAN